MKPVIVGTAGHIDHGKSTLLEALTGTDPDRLEEEQRRGLTIDIGFAFLTEDIAFIDVPGHERFIKNMVTGASTIDMAMLIVAADDGVMPQTREHLNIIQLLGIKSGIVVITKIDLVSNDWLELVLDDVQKFLRGTILERAQIFEVSSITGEGISELKEGILTACSGFQREIQTTIFRLPVDRVFLMKGYGTVVTGSVISGEVSIGDTVEIQPIGKNVRVRGVQSHNRTVDSISYGHRAAVNLQGVEKRLLKRGQFLCTPGYYSPAKLLTCHLTLLSNIDTLSYNTRVRVHLGTGEFLGRVRFIGQNELKHGESAIAQIVFEEKISAGFRERFVIRSYSPLATIGGGIVVDVNPKPLKRKSISEAEGLKRLINADLISCVRWFFKKHGLQIIKPIEIARNFSAHLNKVSKLLEQLEEKGEISLINDGFILNSIVHPVKDEILELLSSFHKVNPLRIGIGKQDIFKKVELNEVIGNWILEVLRKEKKVGKIGDKIHLLGFEPILTEAKKVKLVTLENEILKGGFSPPEKAELSLKLSVSEDELENMIALLLYEQKIVILEKGMIFHKDIVEKGEKTITSFLKEKGQATVSELRQVLDTSRKWTVPLLIYYDRKGLTRRDGDLRKLV